MRIVLAVCFLIPTAVFAQEFNPDQSAYSISQNAIALAGYARTLEKRIDVLQKQIAEMKKTNPAGNDKGAKK